MKKKLVFSAIPAVMLAFGLVMAGCSGGGGGGDGTGIIPTPIADEPATYSASNIELKVAKTAADLNKAAITPASGNWYLLKYNSAEVSRGRILINGSGEWTFNATAGTVQTGFKAKIENGGLKFTSDVKKTAGSGGQVIINSNTSLTPGSAAGLQWPAAMEAVWADASNNQLKFEDGKYGWSQPVYGPSDGFTLVSVSGNSYTIEFSGSSPDCTFTAVVSNNGNTLTISGSNNPNLVLDAAYTKQP